MKKLFPLLLLCCMFATSCSMHEFAPGDPLLAHEDKVLAAKKACYEHRQTIDTTNMSEVGKLALAQQKSYEKIIASITGKPVDECSEGTNLYDVMKEEVKEKNETARSIGHDVKNVATGTIIGITIDRALGNAFKSSGDKIGGDRVGGDKIGGDSVGGDKPITTTTTEAAATAGTAAKP